MAKNIGYLSSGRTIQSDEVFTPSYVPHAIAKYIPNNIENRITNILCPFSKNEHEFSKQFRELGYNVVNTHFDPATNVGKNFFDYTKEEITSLNIDYIIDNPPFSLKCSILERCEELDVAYALLLPLPTLQGNKRYQKVFSKGNTQALIFAQRIGYGTKEKTWQEMGMTNHFASIFICKGVLPQSLIFDELKVIQ